MSKMWLALALIVTNPAYAADVKSSFYDRNGFFMGTSIKNPYGTTSYYDRWGHFMGTEKKRK